MLNFDFLEKGLEEVSPPPCMYNFQKKKKFLMLLFSINPLRTPRFQEMHLI